MIKDELRKNLTENSLKDFLGKINNTNEIRYIMYSVC